MAPLVSNEAPQADCHWKTSAKLRLGPDKKINTFLNTTFLRSGSVAPPVPLSALPCRMVRTAIECPGAARPVGQAVWRAFAHQGSAPRTDGRDRPRVGSGMVPGQVAEGLRPLDVGRPRAAAVGSGSGGGLRTKGLGTIGHPKIFGSACGWLILVRFQFYRRFVVMDEARGIKSYSSDKQFLRPQPPSPLFRFRAFALETGSGRGPPEMNSVVSCWRNAMMCSPGTIFVFTRSQMNRTSSPAAAPASVPSPLERPPKIPTARRSKKKWSSPVSNQMSQPQGNSPKKSLNGPEEIMCDGEWDRTHRIRQTAEGSAGSLWVGSLRLNQCHPTRLFCFGEATERMGGRGAEAHSHSRMVAPRSRVASSSASSPNHRHAAALVTQATPSRRRYCRPSPAKPKLSGFKVRDLNDAEPNSTKQVGAK